MCLQRISKEDSIGWWFKGQNMLKKKNEEKNIFFVDKVTRVQLLIGKRGTKINCCLSPLRNYPAQSFAEGKEGGGAHVPLMPLKGEWSPKFGSRTAYHLRHRWGKSRRIGKCQFPSRAGVIGKSKPLFWRVQWARFLSRRSCCSQGTSLKASDTSA